MLDGSDRIIFGSSIVLNRSGHCCGLSPSNNPQQADDALQTHRFDGIILDIDLPRLNGEHILRSLRARDDHTPVLVTTTRRTANPERYYQAQGANDFLGKSYTFEQLARQVHHLLAAHHDEART